MDKLFNKLPILPKHISCSDGTFSWPRQSLLVSTSMKDNLPLTQLQRKLKKDFSLKSRITYNAFGPATLRIRRDPALKQAEAYRITITPKQIEILSGSDSGAYYAVQTLCDMIALFGNHIPSCRIDDAPDLRRRGIYHDCSRGKVPTLETLKQLAERLSHWKINELQLYIENVFTFVRYPQIGKNYSPLTPGEILSLQEHCRKHHIRFVGSLASFGHMEKILSLPEFQHLGELPGYRDYPAGTCLCPTNPGSIKLVRELYEEFVPLFDAIDFNVCCDETWELGRGRSQRKADRIGIGRVYLDFFLKIYKLCNIHGKRMNAWADILLKYPDLLSQLPKDICLLNWEYEQNGENIKRTEEIANAGINMMVCPGTSSWLTHGSRIPNAMNNVKASAVQAHKHQAEGMLITDWGDDGHRNFLGISLHGFAHGAAHAWNKRGVDEERFTENFCRSTFNQKGNKLSKAITRLGSTYLTCGAQSHNRSVLFDALYEPIENKEIMFSSIDRLKEPGLKKIINQLSGSLGPSIPTGIPEFERTALKELKLAASMDLLAAKRALAVKQIRKGQSPQKNYMVNLAKQMESITRRFSKLWLLRNKRSQLTDNIRLFRKIQNEMLKVGR